MTNSVWLGFVERCADAERLVLAAPYMKFDALGMALDGVGRGASIECFTRWTPVDIHSGASDIACRTLVNDAGGSFRLHNRLHAKYYRVDNHVLIGSANLTLAGLGFSPSPNFEILAEAPSSFDWPGFESRLQRESREVTNEEFALWERCLATKIDPPNLESPVMGIGDWKPQTRSPDYLWWAYSGTRLPSDEQHGLAMTDLAEMGMPPDLDRETFEGWIRVALLASPFVDFVLERVGLQNEPEIWDAVCQEWNLADRATASRLIQTVENWTQQYDLGARVPLVSSRRDPPR